MNKKTLIINGSPRTKGNTAFLINELKKHLKGDIAEVSAYRNKISPCIDCRRCEENAVCAVKDDMQIIYNDDYDNVVLATPVYYATLPGPVHNLLSRFQHWHIVLDEWKKPLPVKPKKAGLIITAGGRKNEDGVNRHAYIMFKMMNAKGFEEHTVKSAQTDTIAAFEDKKAIAEIAELASWLNAE